MGTALASFVAGILIVFTAFDQTQVTKVDSLQGPIREMRAKVQFWGDVIDKDTASWNSLKEVRVQAEKDLEVSKTYLVYLRKESDKMQQNDPQATSEYQSQKSAKFTAAIDQTRMGITELEAILSRPEIWERQYPDSASSALLEDIRRLSLRTDILKAEMASFELMSHLAGKSADDINNSAHYADLIGISSTLYARVSTIDASSPPQTLDNELGLIEKDIVPLTRQSPYTLLMMRIVEIGLPLLLSIFSIFFVLRYTLTEKRSRQVQEQLRERNIMRS